MGTPSPNIVGTSTGTVAKLSGLVISGDLNDAGNSAADTWSITSGPSFGTASISSATGLWTYDLDDTNATVLALHHGSTLTDTFSVVLSDAGGTSTKVVSITITVPCFAAGTLIETAEGCRPIEDLKPGELVRTRDHGMQPLRWIGCQRVTAAELQRSARLRPVLVPAGALAGGVPHRDLLVSRQHRLLLQTRTAEVSGGTRDSDGVLIPAILLTETQRAVAGPSDVDIDYWHLLFDRHEIVFVEGVEAESLLLGPMALRALPARTRKEICALFPDAEAREQLATPARPIPERHVQRAIMREFDAGLPTQTCSV
ncbi:MAG: Hint domain-containing protein [Rhodobacteraceae bacterium]|nr:Hint domain-containing protein [Paracoccaceae bacterium]